MKYLFALILTLSVTIPTLAQDKAVTILKNSTKATTYYFIRHSEKDRSDTKNMDPNLIQKGVFRAAKWSYILEHISFNAVYSTDYNRTKQTALPTAEKNGLELTLYDPNNLYSEKFIANTRGKTILVVGHSNTTPKFVNLVLGQEKYQNIDDANNANLYIVTISNCGEISDTLLVID